MTCVYKHCSKTESFQAQTAKKGSFSISACHLNMTVIQMGQGGDVENNTRHYVKYIKWLLQLTDWTLKGWNANNLPKNTNLQGFHTAHITACDG